MNRLNISKKTQGLVAMNCIYNTPHKSVKVVLLLPGGVVIDKKYLAIQ